MFCNDGIVGPVATDISQPPLISLRAFHKYV